MDDTRAEVSSDPPERAAEPAADGRSAWERAFDGPPINPRSELIYHDHKPRRSRHT